MKRIAHLRNVFVAAAAIVAQCCAQHAEAAIPFTNVWKGAVNGSYTAHANWNPDTGNLGNSNLTILTTSLGGGSPVVLNASATIGGLVISNDMILTRSSADTSARNLTINTVTATDSSLNNAGIIKSGGTSGTMAFKLEGGATTYINDGVIQADPETELDITDPGAGGTPVITNINGVIRTVGDGVLGLANNDRTLTIIGGILSNPSGTIDMGMKAGTLTLQDVVCTNGGAFNVLNQTSGGSINYLLDFKGSTRFVNTGSLNVLGDGDMNSSRFPFVAIEATTVSFDNEGTVSLLAQGGTNITTGNQTINFRNNATVTLTNNGTMTFTSQSTNLAVYLQLNGAATDALTLAGTGTVRFIVGALGAPNKVALTGNGTLINGASHTIRGAGYLCNNTTDLLLNQGTIVADDATTPLTLNVDAAFTNAAGALLRAAGGGGLVIGDDLYDNYGTVQVDTGSSLTILTNAVFVNHTSAVVRVDGTLTNAIDLAIAGGSLQGSGTVQRSVTLTGASPTQRAAIEPGDSGSGTLTVRGNVTLNDNSSLVIDVAGGHTASLNVAGSGQLKFTDGATQRLELNAPSGLRSGIIATFAARTGSQPTFDEVYCNGSLVPDPAATLPGGVKLVYSDTSIMLVAPAGVVVMLR